MRLRASWRRAPLSVGPVVGLLAAIGVVAIWAAKRSSRRFRFGGDSGGHGSQSQTSSPRLANFAALISVAVVVGEWCTKTVAAYHHGILSTDSLWYHMPFAARFVQDGSITPLHYVDSEPVTVFFPASSELFHSFGMLVMGNDLLSPLLNMLWLGLALLASWCIGRPFGVAPIAVAGARSCSQHPDSWERSREEPTTTWSGLPCCSHRSHCWSIPRA